MKYALALLVMLGLSAPALAQSKPDAATDGRKLEGTTYAPEYCDFTATFPGQAFISRRCEDESKERCYDLVSFTKVFDLAATVRVDIICNPSTPAMYDQLTLEAMKTTVRAMTESSVLEAYDVNAREDSNFRQASLLGKGSSGVHDTLYIAQLWSGKNSMMSVEAQLIGDPMEAADSMFAEILKSIGPKDAVEPVPEGDQTQAVAPETEENSSEGSQAP